MTTALGRSEWQPLYGSPTDVKSATVALRQGFVRKVYGILAAQLVLTTLIACPMQRVDNKWLQSNQWLLALSVVMTMVTMCAMHCCRDVAKKFPSNYALLFTFTAFEGVLVGFINAMYTWQSVLLAAGITVVVFMGLTVFAFLSNTDFTGMGPYLFAFGMTLCVFGFVLCILNICGIHVPGLIVLYDFLGVLLFLFYIIFDTQRILGEWGGHSQQFAIDDYVLAALQLYMDIINLFMHILRLIGQRK